MKVGDQLQDNDPRAENRILTITAILPEHIEAENCAGQRRRYLLKRIHTDGKPRRSGLNLATSNT